MLEQTLTAYLKADAGVSALLPGSNTGDVYPVALPQNPPYPCLRYERLETEPRVHSHDADARGYVTAHIRIEAWDEYKNYLVACNLAQAVMDALEAFRGNMSDGQSPEGYVLNIGNIMASGPRDVFAAGPPAIVGRQMEFRIQYIES